MRILVTGDRNWYCLEPAESVVNRVLLRYGPGMVIVHGGATGIDRSFAEACDELGVEQEAHPTRWDDLDHPQAVIRYDKNGRPYNAKAGPIRNGEMVAAGAEMCIAFHRAISASSVAKPVMWPLADLCRESLHTQDVERHILPRQVRFTLRWLGTTWNISEGLRSK
jgi:hypothetical protein